MPGSRPDTFFVCLPCAVVRIFLAAVFGSGIYYRALFVSHPLSFFQSSFCFASLQTTPPPSLLPGSGLYQSAFRIHSPLPIFTRLFSPLSVATASGANLAPLCAVAQKSDAPTTQQLIPPQIASSRNNAPPLRSPMRHATAAANPLALRTIHPPPLDSSPIRRRQHQQYQQRPPPSLRNQHRQWPPRDLSRAPEPSKRLPRPVAASRETSSPAEPGAHPNAASIRLDAVAQEIDSGCGAQVTAATARRE